MASLSTRISDLLTAVSTSVRALRTVVTGSATGGLTTLTTTDKTSIIAAINEVKAAGGGATNLDALTDVVITAAATGDIIRFNGTNWVDVDGSTIFDLAGAAAAAQAASQPLDSDLTSIAALSTTAYGRAFLALANQAALLALFPAASETVASLAEIATQAETDTGTDDARFVSPLKLQTRLAAFAQPLDADLTNIAALTTTAYGRAFLTLANQAALMALLSTGTTAAAGILQLATSAQVVTGTDTALATTAAGVKAAIDARVVNDGTLAANSTTNAPSQASVVTYVAARIATLDVMTIKGGLDASANPNYPAANAGDVYRITVGGKVGGASGDVVAAGDMIFCFTDGSAAGTKAAVGANWDIVEMNLDGAVIGPASAVSTNLAAYSGTSGKLIADSGFTPSNAAIGGGSATVLPTSAQVVAYAQPVDADLTSIAAVASAANKMLYATGANTWALTDLTAFARTLLDDADAATARGTLSVYSIAEIGTADTDFATAYNTALNA